MSKIGLFGGSFDPIHKAHTYIASIALSQLGLDEVQFIPTKNNPWKEGSCASNDDRIAMISLAIQSYEKMLINTIEIESDDNSKNYTIDTIIRLKELHPENEYYYIMGMDQANLFYKWKEAKRISENVSLVAFQRGGYLPNKKCIKDFDFTILDNEPVIASSSDVRNGDIEMLDKEVLRYITKHSIYLETIVSKYMKKKRWEHTLNVAKLASEIAKENHLNEKQAYIAGMFHDIAKEMEYEDSYKIMNKHFKKYIDKPVAIWHQWISCYLSETLFLIDDQVVLDAIQHHTTASIEISAIGKCVYVADKLDPLRGYDSSSQIEVCKGDIHQGFKDCLIDFYEFSKLKGRDIDDCFYEIYDYFVIKGEK